MKLNASKRLASKRLASKRLASRRVTAADDKPDWVVDLEKALKNVGDPYKILEWTDEDMEDEEEQTTVLFPDGLIMQEHTMDVLVKYLKKYDCMMAVDSHDSKGTTVTFYSDY